jgi:multiple sugar transport system substrate-binding protein
VSGDVVFWTYPIGIADSVEWWDPYVEAFNEEFPDVNVEVVLQAWSGREESLVTAISGGNAPDVVYFNPDFIPQYAEEDLLEPLTDLRDDWDDFFDSSLEAMTWEGTLYGAPLLMQYSSPYCNVDALDAAGVDECPTTWDQFRDAAPKFANAGYYATEYNGVATLNHNFYVYLWQAGGQVLSDDLQSAAFNSPEGLEALEFIKEMVDEGWVPQQPLSVAEPFEQTAAGRGEVGYITGAQLVVHRTVIDPELIQTVEPMSHREQVAFGSVGAWSIFNTTDAPEAAKAWVRYLSDEEFIAEFNETTGYLPPRQSVDYLFEDDPQTAAGMEYLDTVRVGVMHPKARQIIDVIRPHIQSVLIDGNDPQSALDAAEQEVNDLLARG